jgi:hypothetical protein
MPSESASFRSRQRRLEARQARETSRASATVAQKSGAITPGAKTVVFDTTATFAAGTYKVTAGMTVSATATDSITFSLRAGGLANATPTATDEVTPNTHTAETVLSDVITTSGATVGTFGIQAVDAANNVAVPAGQAWIIVEPLF